MLSQISSEEKRPLLTEEKKDTGKLPCCPEEVKVKLISVPLGVIAGGATAALYLVYTAHKSLYAIVSGAGINVVMNAAVAQAVISKILSKQPESFLTQLQREVKKISSSSKCTSVKSAGLMGVRIVFSLMATGVSTLLTILGSIKDNDPLIEVVGFGVANTVGTLWLNFFPLGGLGNTIQYCGRKIYYNLGGGSPELRMWYFEQQQAIAYLEQLAYMLEHIDVNNLDDLPSNLLRFPALIARLQSNLKNPFCLAEKSRFTYGAEQVLRWTAGLVIAYISAGQACAPATIINAWMPLWIPSIVRSITGHAVGNLAALSTYLLSISAGHNFSGSIFARFRSVISYGLGHAITNSDTFGARGRGFRGWAVAGALLNAALAACAFALGGDSGKTSEALFSQCPTTFGLEIVPSLTVFFNSYWGWQLFFIPLVAYLIQAVSNKTRSPNPFQSLHTEMSAMLAFLKTLSPGEFHALLSADEAASAPVVVDNLSPVDEARPSLSGEQTIAALVAKFSSTTLPPNVDVAETLPGASSSKVPNSEETAPPEGLCAKLRRWCFG